MKASMRLVMLSLSIPALAACASMDERSDTAPAAASAPSLMEEDHAYMAQVERIAKGRGIEVVWINAPTRRPADDAGDDN
jgi:hypothetical protein